MTDYENFYENLKEARRRIRNTVVLYDGLPYYVLCISDHRSDGIFRVYLDPLVTEGSMEHRVKEVPYDWMDSGDRTVGHVMDEYLERERNNTKIIRKMMNSPKFNRFRPFPLGMTNYMNQVCYLTRTPTRPLTNQGLVSSAVKADKIDLNPSNKFTRGMAPSLYDTSMCKTILGLYPSINEVIDNLRDPDIIDQGCAFHREFAVLRGPINTLFLAYKTDIIGLLCNKDTSRVMIPREFAYCKEVTEELGVFNEIITE